jgi:hypothetical protein
LTQNLTKFAKYSHPLGLESGYETPSLILLAGLSDDENLFLVDDYLKKTIDELNVEFKEPNQAALFLIKSIADRILNNSVDTYIGCDFIFGHILRLTSLRNQDEKFVYDSIGLADIYGLYVAAEELKNAMSNRDKYKTNELLIEEMKNNIKTKFEIWNNQVSPRFL